MKRNLLLLAVLIASLLAGYGLKRVTANSEAAKPTPTPEVFQPLPADQRAFEAVRATLAEELKVDPLTITLESAEAVEWTDSCLGLGGPAESCLQAITPGFLVTVKHDGTVYEFHTDQTGESVREVK